MGVKFLGMGLLFIFFVTAKPTDEVKTKCREFYDFPSSNISSPSSLADLKVELVTYGGEKQLNISWAINIDASIEYLTATRIIIQYHLVYHCEYDPPLFKANLTGSKQKWFQYLTNAIYGPVLIQAANIPLGIGLTYKNVEITITTPKPTDMKAETTEVSQVYSEESDQGQEAASYHALLTSLAIATFGVLACLLILSCFYITYKNFGVNFATSLCSKGYPSSPVLAVPILVVYPAKNSKFQEAVVALAEFLHWQAGCSVAVDIWQQGRIAELGPMRWLAEQARAANQVLIVCPLEKNTLSYSSPSPNCCSPNPSIPAAAQDLYPLVLNMVVSAKSSKDLAKFWVVLLGDEGQDKSHCNLVPELRACKTFCVMKDLNRLCRSLHKNKREKQSLSSVSRPETAFCEERSAALREAVERIR